MNESQGRLLVVEDDSALRRSLRTTLGVLGFDVIEEPQAERGFAVGAAFLGLASEKDNLVAQPLQRLADGEGERLDATHLGGAGLVEGGVGKEKTDFH